MVEIIRNSIYKINTILKLREINIEGKLDKTMLEFITELKTRLKINGNILKTPNYSKFRKILVFYISSLIIDSITLQIIEHIYANIPISMYDSFPRVLMAFI